MATRKTPDQILDGAADILEKHGWVTEECYDKDLGGYCALGAIAQAVFPKHPKTRIHERSYPLNADGQYTDGVKVDPRHLETVKFLASRLVDKKRLADRKRYCTDDELFYDADVSGFNDDLDPGVEKRYDPYADKFVCTINEKVRYKSSRKVVQRLRSAAKAYRKQQAEEAA